MVNEVLSKKVLTNVPNLVSFLSAATSSLTTDPGLQLQNLTGLAYNLRGINRSNILFMTIPTGPAPTDPNRLVWTSAATSIWTNMAADKPILGQAESPAPATSAPSSASASTPAKTTAPAATVTAAATPSPAVSKDAGHQAFTSADSTGTCS